MIESGLYADQLSIETPEQVSLRFPVAGIGSRFVAVLLDHLLQLLPYVLLTIAIAILFRNQPASDEPLGRGGKWVIAGFGFLSFLWVWGYFTLFEAFWKGQTPGKKVMKLRVIKDSGRPVTFFEALARNLVRFVDYLPGLYLVGVGTMLTNRANKRLGDLAAGTIVVHERAEGHVRFAEETVFTPVAMAARAAGQAAFAADAVSRLSAEDLHVIETFFARVLDLDVVTRERLAGRLAETMLMKMGTEMPEGMGAERMLELVVFRMRGLGR